MLVTSTSPYADITPTSENTNYKYIPNEGTGIISITVEGTSINMNQPQKVLDVSLRSIAAFPTFLMDWYHRQMDEIVASLSSFPDLRIYLPDFSSNFADPGWSTKLNQ